MSTTTGPEAQPTFDEGVREATPAPTELPDDLEAAPRLGPDSLTWKYFGDWRVHVFGFQRIAGTENSIEQIEQGIRDHSVFFNDPIARANRTARSVMRSIYSDDPYGWGRQVRDFHRDIKGEMPDASRYHALNPELWYWIHATFVDQLIYVTDTFIRRLSEEEKVQIFEESKVWYGLYGVSSRSQPQSYEEFCTYLDGMHDRLATTPTVRYATGYLRQGLPGPRWMPKPVWRIVSAPANAALRTVIVGTLPPQLRESCDLPWNDRKERRFQRFAAVARALDPVVNRLPMRVRYTRWALEGWEREGVDPRKRHDRPSAVLGSDRR